MSTIGQVAVRLEALTRDADKGGQKAAEAMGLLLQRELVTGEYRRYSHPPGTKTPSPPGQPPALVTGRLRASVRKEPASGARQVGPHRFQTKVGPTTVYGRIQELGGRTGRNHATVLPARPAVMPAVARNMGRLNEVSVKAFKQATGQ